MGQESCSLCQEIFADTPEMPVAVTGCQHAFHQWCVFGMARDDARCPNCREIVAWGQIPCFRHLVRRSGREDPSGHPAARVPTPAAAASSSASASGGGDEFRNMRFVGDSEQTGASSSQAVHHPYRDYRTIPEHERQTTLEPPRRKGKNPPHERKGSKGGKGGGSWSDYQWRDQWSWGAWSGSAWKKGRYDWQGK